MTYFLVEDKTHGDFILLRRKRKTNFLEIVAIAPNNSSHLKVGDKHTVPLDRLFDLYLEGQVRTISKKEARMYLL